MTPHWIPELETQNIGEEFSSYENRLYDIFRRDFILSHPTYDNLTVTVRRHEEEEDGKWAGFFHITSTEDHATGERITDVRRCERIRYPRPTVQYCRQCPQCAYTICEKPMVWKEPWRGRTRANILVDPERYLVVLEPHPEKPRPYCMLVTAYYLDQEHSYRKQLRRYEQAKNRGDKIQ